MGLSLEEQETHITWCREEQCASVTTTDRTVMTKLDKLCEAHPENYQCIRVSRMQDDHSIAEKVYEIADKGLISFRGFKKSLTMTDEQRKAAADRLRSLRMPKSDE